MSHRAWIPALLVLWASGVRAEDAAPTPVLLHVAPDGNDSWSGGIAAPRPDQADGPFATIPRARDAVRALPKTRPVRVLLHGGTHALTEPLVFGPEDSGTETAPVTYAAAPGETPVISGGRRITGWKAGPDGTWTAPAPGGIPFRQLFLSGRRGTRARSPNTGFFRVQGEVEIGPPSRFKSRPGDLLPGWADRGDVEVIVLQAWAEARLLIRGVAPDGTATFSGGCAKYNRQNDARYWIENAPEALDAPGEWRLDRASGVVAYRPMPGEDPGRVEAFAAGIPLLVHLGGTRHLRFEGLTFAHADWTLKDSGYADTQAAYDIPAAFEAVAAEACAVEDCTFAHLGGYAVQLGFGCRGNRIVGDTMTDLGAGGVKIGGETSVDFGPSGIKTGGPAVPPGTKDTVGENIVSDNHIHDIGVVYPAAVAVWIGQSDGNRVEHNHIHDTYYTAVSVGWTWGYGESRARDNVIAYNHIHDIGRGMLSDQGAIYTLGVQPGTVIHHNRIHDVDAGYGAWGIYTDEGSSGIVIEDNIVDRTKCAGFHQHYGRDNVVRNNVFALGKEAQVQRSRGEKDRSSFTFERNIVYWTEGAFLAKGYADDTGKGYTFDHNLYYKIGGWDGLDEWRRHGQDANSVVADPLFEDPAKGDFRLKPGSPALALGFRPIDLSGVGPRPAAER